MLLGEILLYRSPQRLKAALDRLKNEVRRNGPDSAAVWSDLAAGYLVEAQRQEEPFALFAALDAANRAIALDEHYAEARFNRALALEYLGLEASARKAWNEELKLDRNPSWAGEARQRLARLDREARATAMRADATERWAKAALDNDARAGAELARHVPEQARQLVEYRLLPRWGSTALAGDPVAADRDLATAKAIAAALRPVDGDALLGEALTAINAAISPYRLDELRRGHRDFGEGMALFQERRFGLARPHFEAALANLRDAKSPFADWAALYLAICEYQSGKPGRAAVQLGKLTPRLDSVRTPALAGRVLWQLGLSEGVRGEYASAVTRLGKAADSFRRNRDGESLAAVENVLASTYDALGDRYHSWHHRYMALRSLTYGSTERRWVVVKAMAENLIERDRPDLALPILDELVRISGDNPERRAQAFLRRSMALIRLRRLDPAERDYRAAEAAVARIPDPSLRARVGVDVLVSRAAALAQEKPEEALRLLDEARHFYNQTEHEFLLARVLLARAHAAAAAGREEEAERDLDNALTRAEHRFGKIAAPDLKLSFLGELQTAFDDLLLAQYPRNPEAAFTTAERARSRVLLDRTGSSPLSAVEIRAALPPGVALLEYAIVRDRLLIWVLTRESFSPAVVEWTPAGGPDLVRGLAQDVATSAGLAELRQRLTRLYDLLIQPVSSHLPPESLLVIAPNGDLGSVPFSALIDRATGQYLIEGHPLVVAPSASLYLAALRHARRLSSHPVHSLLAIADPAFDHDWHSSLPSLPGARQEVAGIAQIYSPGALVLVGERATPGALAAAIQGHDVLHLAAHTITNPKQPDRSALVLAPPDREPSAGDLMAANIEHLSLADTRLTVLASCGGASGTVAAGEGTLSLARSFLAAGTPAVVAGLWSVDDQLAATLFLRFHERLRMGKDAVTALREVQLAMLQDIDESRRSPRSWGGFQVFGAVASREKSIQRPSH
ncbi:MAG: CHAT domain-containing protein [Thermoanaerobaculia bacterium]